MLWGGIDAGFAPRVPDWTALVCLNFFFSGHAAEIQWAISRVIQGWVQASTRFTCLPALVSHKRLWVSASENPFQTQTAPLSLSLINNAMFSSEGHFGISHQTLFNLNKIVWFTSTWTESTLGRFRRSIHLLSTRLVGAKCFPRSHWCVLKKAISFQLKAILFPAGESQQWNGKF